ncbi:MAG TPA: MerR family transcriptional regulator [Thermoanaerobaculia bacterium]
MLSKARVQKRLYYKIGEACKALGIQPYVLRYWETEFPARTPSKSRSGQRVYSEKELEIIRRIKELLYEEGYTIAGAKKKLEGELAAGALGEVKEEPVTADLPLQPPPPRRPSAEPDAAAPPALDTSGDERVERLVSGIAGALQEARELLELLRPKDS